jgi:hypothetical protein
VSSVAPGVDTHWRSGLFFQYKNAGEHSFHILSDHAPQFRCVWQLMFTHKVCHAKIGVVVVIDIKAIANLRQQTIYTRNPLSGAGLVRYWAV